MASEIERKFLVKGFQWKSLAKGELFRQGYLSLAPESTVRVRVAGSKGYLTVKGKTKGVTRSEYEYEIPISDAASMLDNLCSRSQIEKIRYQITHAGKIWEIDEFLGDNAGLVVAEIELDSEDQKFDLPEWVGEEVSTDQRYYNSNLTKHPFSQWEEVQRHHG